jgi:putative addiction module component (TIGR02574 family)
MTMQAIKEMLGTLSPEERAELAHFLLRSLDGEEEDPQEVEAAWKAELERRGEEIASGKEAGIPAEEFFLRLRESLR